MKRIMKKTLTITFVAALLAAGSAFASKMAADPEWYMYNDTFVTGSAQYIKNFYCSGPNNIQCAIQLDQPNNVIRKP